MRLHAADCVLFSTLATTSGHVFARATLNAPSNLNALSLAMIDRLAPRLDAWAADPSVAGVMLDATGGKAFCAGGDVVALHHAIRAADAAVPPEAAAFFEREYRLDHRIHTYPKPFLCWGHGIVMGGGVGLLAGASHRVVTPATRLAMPEIGIGLYPDVGGSRFLGRMPGRLGLFLALTGIAVNAHDARVCGLADVVLRHEDQPGVLAGIAAAAWQGDAAADAARLTLLLEVHAAQASAATPASSLRRHFGRIEELLGPDGLHDIAPRLRALAHDTDPWLARAGESFAEGSPTSAVLSFALQQRARHLSLAEVFRLEYQASVGCCVHHDFAEGVRALLVDKDRSARWRPATLEEALEDGWLEDHLAPRFTGTHPLADLC